MRYSNKEKLFKKFRIFLNTLILLLAAFLVFHCISTLNTFIHANPFVYTKYIITKEDKKILNSVNIYDDTPIVLYDDLDKYHSNYSVYQNDKLIFSCKYPSDDEQNVIDLVLATQNQKWFTINTLLFIAILARIFICFKSRSFKAEET